VTIAAFKREGAWPWPADERKFSIAIHNGEGVYLADVTVPTEELALAVLARLNGQELPDEVSSVLMKGEQ
jgi:hypothetical protein